MKKIHPQFITDTAGQKLVVLPLAEFDRIIEELEDMEDVRLYDEAKKSGEPSIPLEEAFKIIEANRNKKQ